MGILRFNGQDVELDGLGTFLLHLDIPDGAIIANDTEASGLYRDGDWSNTPADNQPLARVSTISLAWRDSQGRLNTLAIPFDQGKVGGKPGRWNEDRQAFDILDHTITCPAGDTIHFVCECAPWNFGLNAWADFMMWMHELQFKQSMHNKKYDLHIYDCGLREAICCGQIGHTVECMGSGINLVNNVVWDTQIAQGILEPLHSSALKPTAARIFGEDARDEEEKKNAALARNGVGLTKRYDLLSWDDIKDYAATDAMLTFMLTERHFEQIDTGEIDSTDHKVIMQDLDTASILFKMEQRGVPLKVKEMREEARKMRQAVVELEKALPFEPANINGAKRFFFEELGTVPVKTTDVCKHCRYNIGKRKPPRGKNEAWKTCAHEPSPALDSEVVSRLASMKIKGAEDWLQLANNRSALSKWYTAWPNLVGHDGRIRTNFRLGRVESDRKGMRGGGAISGRLSAERVQLQGVPQDWRIPEGIVGVKHLFAPPIIDGEEGEIWELDLSNAEVRVAAWVSRCVKLAQRINSGENIHDTNTRSIFNIGPDHSDWDKFRTASKRAIFGTLYSAGINTLKSQIDNDLKEDIPRSQIQAVVSGLDNEYPELKQTSRRAERKVNKAMGGCGFVRLVNGRRRVFGPAEHTYKAYNAIIQGGVAETVKALMIEVEREFPGVLINQVHDSLWVQVPKQDFTKEGKQYVFKRAEDIVPTIIRMGEALFTETFSTKDNPIIFTMDAKRLVG